MTLAVGLAGAVAVVLAAALAQMVNKVGRKF
jgi:hypothetical protein